MLCCGLFTHQVQLAHQEELTRQADVHKECLMTSEATVQQV